MLTDSKVKTATPRERTFKLADGRGLTLMVMPNGSKLWRFRYRWRGRERMLSMGQYPDVSLKLARDKRDDARKQIAAGVEPSDERKAAKLRRSNTFKSIAQEYLAQREKPPARSKRAPLSEGTLGKSRWLLETFAYPYIGNEPITDIKARDVLALLRRVDDAGHHETARRTKQLIGRVFRFAIATERAEYDITAGLRGALTPVVVQNHAGITSPERIGELLRAIDTYSGEPHVKAALRLAPYVFVRPGELRGAQWSEFDLVGKQPEWRIPAKRMKMGREHVVPLSRQAIEIVRNLHLLTGSGIYLFPSLRTRERCMSETTLNAALRRLGFTKDEMTPHGFRTMASTQLNERGVHPDLIELQLAHKPRGVRADYNKAERLADRRKVMQAWADWLDEMKANKPK